MILSLTRISTPWQVSRPLTFESKMYLPFVLWRVSCYGYAVHPLLVEWHGSTKIKRFIRHFMWRTFLKASTECYI